MKKLLLLPIVLLLFSCVKHTPTPIEKYSNRGIVVIHKPYLGFADLHYTVQCKTKDSIFNIYLVTFDAEKLKVGDTIK